jgi:hypothetical protein
MIPYANATLTAITPVASSADYDQLATDGTPRWTGELGIYVVEERREVLGADREDEVLQTRVEIPYAIGRLAERGDTLTYTYENAIARRVAATITRAQLVGRVRVLLEDG